MGQLDSRRGRHDVVVDPRAEFRGEQGQQWAKPLAAGAEQMGIGLRDERVIVIDAGAQERFHGDQPNVEAMLQFAGDPR